MTAGMVSKTDIMGAFYVGLPVETPLADIMVGPPLFCYPDERSGNFLRPGGLAGECAASDACQRYSAAILAMETPIISSAC